jgi:alkylresorcinol/alkylpyrone synthase
MAHISAVATVLPPHTLTQEQILDILQDIYRGNSELARMLPVFKRAGVRRRHFSFSPEYYLSRKTFEERNCDFVAQALDLAERAATCCLRKAGVDPEQVDHVFLVTTTGLATPSLDALLVNRIGLRPDVRRSPLFGLGCAGGAGALGRAAEYVDGVGEARALVVSVELSGQIFNLEAQSAVNLVGVALFGDGCAAALLESGPHAECGPAVVASKSVLFPRTEHVMGWRFNSDGMQLQLSQEVADLVKGPFREAVEAFVSQCGATIADIAHWLLHPGGRKVLESYAEAFGLHSEDLRWSRRCLAEMGNLSSASVLFILDEFIGQGAPPRDKTKALLAALGPGFAAELLLLQWGPAA